MGYLIDEHNNIFNVSPNIMVLVDDNNIGEMYIYESNYGYILNGATASDLVDYFAYKDKINLSNEILDTLMGMTINKGVH